jgi:hypothetical protein
MRFQSFSDVTPLAFTARASSVSLKCARYFATRSSMVGAAISSHS